MPNWDGNYLSIIRSMLMTGRNNDDIVISYCYIKVTRAILGIQVCLCHVLRYFSAHKECRVYSFKYVFKLPLYFVFHKRLNDIIIIVVAHCTCVALYNVCFANRIVCSILINDSNKKQKNECNSMKINMKKYIYKLFHKFRILSNSG